LPGVSAFSDVVFNKEVFNLHIVGNPSKRTLLIWGVIHQKVTDLFTNITGLPTIVNQIEKKVVHSDIDEQKSEIIKIPFTVNTTLAKNELQSTFYYVFTIVILGSLVIILLITTILLSREISVFNRDVKKRKRIQETEI
jgi:hypothetical protein